MNFAGRSCYWQWISEVESRAIGLYSPGAFPAFVDGEQAMEGLDERTVLPEYLHGRASGQEQLAFCDAPRATTNGSGSSIIAHANLWRPSKGRQPLLKDEWSRSLDGHRVIHLPCGERGLPSESHDLDLLQRSKETPAEEHEIQFNSWWPLSGNRDSRLLPRRRARSRHRVRRSGQQSLRRIVPIEASILHLRQRREHRQERALTQCRLLLSIHAHSNGL